MEVNQSVRPEASDQEEIISDGEEVEEKKDAARGAFESVYPGEYDTFQLTEYEDSDDLEERIGEVFSDEFHGGYTETYDTDDVIERLVKELVDGTPSE